MADRADEEALDSFALAPGAARPGSPGTHSDSVELRWNSDCSVIATAVSAASREVVQHFDMEDPVSLAS